MTADVLPWQGLEGAPHTRYAEVDAAQFQAEAARQHHLGSRLLGLWGLADAQGPRVAACWMAATSLDWIELAVPDGTSYPDLSSRLPSADRLQRAAFDLVGLRADGGDSRPWLRHAAWPADAFPLRDSALEATSTAARGDTEYPFVRVEGPGVHEIPVGPVHAGIIEPGHFRFSVVGEKVLRLEQRLGYVHKGIEHRLQHTPLAEGHRLVGRVSGDCTVAYAWAYCQALEGMAQHTVSARAAALRGLALERERLANHLGDLGALGNDAGFAFGFTQFMRLKEQLVRLNQRLFGRRYLFDFVCPGGVDHDLDAAGVIALREESLALEDELNRLREIYDNHAGVQDRFVDCGRVSPALARHLGVLGLAARASGQNTDARRDFACAPYTVWPIEVVVREEGDVAARVALRFDEALASLRWCRHLVDALPEGAIRGEVPMVAAGARGLGVIESWRGPVLVALYAGHDQGIARCHPQDPSWPNWPALEHAVIGNIVPDFPLINKSFNLSYSGHDL